ncbi:VanZ family protein [Kineococcus sp. NPDC059986]|uniref:VanZ family protein n=1 Tax=Kineococcus sp. NPDC059986 TaxID=3155538 RepID=UPI00344ED9A5
MLSTLLVTHPWVTPLLLAAVVVVGPFAGAWLVRHRRLAVALTVLALVPVAALTLLPVDRELYARCVAEWALPTPARVESFANLVLFVPPVLLAGVATRRWWVAAVLGSATSALIEVVQALLPALGRSCDTGDWLANTLGSVVGGVLALVALRLAARRRPV